MASDIEIDKCLAALEVVYPNHFKSWTTLEQLTIARKLYHRMWRDIDGHLLEAAVDQWLSTARPFHPSPGELRDLALMLVSGDEKSADEAWIEVLEAIRHIGSYGRPQWSNDLIERTVKAFGWVELCMTETDQMSYARDSFMKIYKAQAARRHDSNLMLPDVKNTIAMLAESKRLTLTDGEK